MKIAIDDEQIGGLDYRHALRRKSQSRTRRQWGRARFDHRAVDQEAKRQMKAGKTRLEARWQASENGAAFSRPHRVPAPGPPRRPASSAVSDGRRIPSGRGVSPNTGLTSVR